jgi:predicted RNase H-like HicB family nuclease
MPKFMPARVWRQAMLTEYIRAAMHRATYEILPNDRTFWGEIPGFQGVWANADSLEACRDELQEAMEDWIDFRLSKGLRLPVIGDLDPNVKERNLA